MTDLIDRLSAATEGSRELDIEIAHAIGWVCPGAEKSPHEGVDRYLGCNWFSKDGREAYGLVDKHPFTTSVDAALTLLPENLQLSHLAWNGKEATVIVGPERAPDYDPVTAATPALALCIAALKARDNA